MVIFLTFALGTAVGDLLAKPVEYGGLGLGSIVISAGFLVAILTLVGLMTMRRERLV